MSLFVAGRYGAAVLLSVFVSLALVPVAVAAAESGTGEHCVIQVIGQKPSGEFITSEPVCFGTFAESMAAASGGSLLLDESTSGSVMFTDEDVGALASTFTLGIHYDGSNGTGASIFVVGSSCSGGWWNTTQWWDNRISSTWNGCNRIKHHDRPNRGGSYGSTWGVGELDNVPWYINNKAESVSYWT